MKGRIAAILAGVLLAAAAQFVALMLGGAGHGWVEPFFFGIVLWPALPLMAARLARRPADGRARLDGAVALAGLALDLLLVQATVGGLGAAGPMFGTGAGRFGEVAATGLPLVLLWLTLWLSWQVAALLLCLRALGRS